MKLEFQPKPIFMKPAYFLLYLLSLITLFGIQTGEAQVGIATVAPRGMLDLASTTSGLVFPRVALTKTTIEAPIINPNGGSLAVGTTVYNTSLTQTGVNDVYPGIYAWNGTKWAAQFIKTDYQKIEQTTLDFRIDPAIVVFTEIPGLTTGTTFTPKYSGRYRMEANFNFGAGSLKPNATAENINMATQEGYFRLKFNGTSYDIYTHSYSIHNKIISGGNSNNGTNYEAFRHDSSLILYLNLTAGQVYQLSLAMDIQVSNDFKTNGSGRGHVGIDVPCTVEFSYLDE